VALFPTRRPASLNWGRDDGRGVAVVDAAEMSQLIRCDQAPPTDRVNDARPGKNEVAIVRLGPVPRRWTEDDRSGDTGASDWPSVGRAKCLDQSGDCPMKRPPGWMAV